MFLCLIKIEVDDSCSDTACQGGDRHQFDDPQLDLPEAGETQGGPSGGLAQVLGWGRVDQSGWCFKSGSGERLAGESCAVGWGCAEWGLPTGVWGADGARVSERLL